MREVGNGVEVIGIGVADMELVDMELVDMELVGMEAVDIEVQNGIGVVEGCILEHRLLNLDFEHNQLDREESLQTSPTILEVGCTLPQERICGNDCLPLKFVLCTYQN